METSANKKNRLRFIHIFIVAAFSMVLINFAISGFAPYFMVLIPAFPFLLLSVFPISWNHVRYPERHGIIGAGIGAFMSTLPATAIFAYDMVTGWKGERIVQCGGILGLVARGSAASGQKNGQSDRKRNFKKGEHRISKECIYRFLIF